MIVDLGQEILVWNHLLQWEDLCDALTEVMQEINPGGEWYAEVHNFSQREPNGNKRFHADTGKELLGLILPNADHTYTFDIYKRDEGLAIDSCHHDPPFEEEWYYIKPLEQTEGETP